MVRAKAWRREEVPALPETAQGKEITMSGNWFIYTLTDPRDLRVRYVGVTGSPKFRLRSHIHNSKSGSTSKDLWIRELMREQCKPILSVIEQGEGDGAGAAERKWVSAYRELSDDLLNISVGGVGRRLGFGSHVLVRISDEDRLQLDQLAKTEERHVNYFIRKALSEFLASAMKIKKNRELKKSA